MNSSKNNKICISTHILVISHNFYDCIVTHIIVSISKYKYKYNCMYSCFIIVSSTYKYNYYYICMNNLSYFIFILIFVRISLMFLLLLQILFCRFLENGNR